VRGLLIVWREGRREVGMYEMRLGWKLEGEKVRLRWDFLGLLGSFLSFFNH